MQVEEAQVNRRVVESSRSMSAQFPVSVLPDTFAACYRLTMETRNEEGKDIRPTKKRSNSVIQYTTVVCRMEV